MSKFPRTVSTRTMVAFAALGSAAEIASKRVAANMSEFDLTDIGITQLLSGVVISQRAIVHGSLEAASKVKDLRPFPDERIP